MKRLLISLSAILLFSSVTMAQFTSNPYRNKNMMPDFLKKGDKVALISPASYIDPSYAEKTADALRSWGLVPVIGPNVGKKDGLDDAGTVKERLSDIRWALEDPDVKALICNRGGYSTIHMVPDIDPAYLKAHPKWLIGFSDITTLHALETCAGVMSIHGTMSRFIGPAEGKDISSVLLRDLLFGTMPRYTLPAHPCNQPGTATGTLVGGNLCTFFPLIGSRADFTWCDDNGIILFIEEVGESFHNIDRIFNMLMLTGVIDRCKGVILGQFTKCSRDIAYDDVEHMLADYLKAYNIPVVCGFPGGHGTPNLPLVIGAPTTINVTETGATISFGLNSKSVQEVRTDQQ